METKKFFPLTFNERFAMNLAYGFGFTFFTSIKELIDNSLHAKSSKITIKIYFDKKTGMHTIEIIDNGIGVPSHKFEKTFSELGGELLNYVHNSISHFGSGGRLALLSLCKKGLINITSYNLGVKSSLELDPIPPSISAATYEVCDKNLHGTHIIIPNVLIEQNGDNFNALLKDLGATYFPHIDNGNKLSITLITDEWTKDVEFSDPFYRKIKNPAIIKRTTAEAEILGKKVYFKAIYFEPEEWNETYTSSWDKKQGSKSVRSASRSGVYFRVGSGQQGSRYISLGDGEFYSKSSAKSDQMVRNGLRIEIEIEQSMFQAIGVKINKSEISPDYNSKDLREFFGTLNTLTKWGQNLGWDYYKNRPKEKGSAKESEKELLLALKNVNSRIKKNKSYGVDSIDWKFKCLDDTTIGEYTTQDSELKITLNSEHNFVEAINRMDKFSMERSFESMVALFNTLNAMRKLGNFNEVINDFEKQFLFIYGQMLNNYANY